MTSKETLVVRADFSVVCSEGGQSVFSEELCILAPRAGQFTNRRSGNVTEQSMDQWHIIRRLWVPLEGLEAGSEREDGEGTGLDQGLMTRENVQGWAGHSVLCISSR